MFDLLEKRFFPFNFGKVKLVLMNKLVDHCHLKYILNLNSFSFLFSCVFSGTKQKENLGGFDWNTRTNRMEVRRFDGCWWGRFSFWCARHLVRNRWLPSFNKSQPLVWMTKINQPTTIVSNPNWMTNFLFQKKRVWVADRERVSEGFRY